MAAPVSYALNDIIQVYFLGKYYGHENMITVCFRVKQAANFNTPIRQDLETWVTHLLSNCANQQSWYGFRHRRIHPVEPSAYADYFFTPRPGVGGAEGMPGQVAALWQIHTEINQPYAKGRFYLPGVPVLHFTNGVYNLNAYTGKNGMKGQLESRYKVGGSAGYIECGVFSRGNHDSVFNGLRSLDYANYPAIQRSRRPTIV